MKMIGDIFSSKARTEVLRVLSEVSEGVGIRAIARLGDVHPHSVELILKKLVAEKLVIKKRFGSRIAYSLNRRHEDAIAVVAVFEAYKRALIAEKAASLRKRSQDILPFIEDASNMLIAAKG